MRAVPAQTAETEDVESAEKAESTLFLLVLHPESLKKFHSLALDATWKWIQKHVWNATSMHAAVVSPESVCRGGCSFTRRTLGGGGY